MNGAEHPEKFGGIAGMDAAHRYCFRGVTPLCESEPVRVHNTSSILIRAPSPDYSGLGGGW